MGPVAPPSTVTRPPRDFGPDGAPTTYFSDPDVLAIDPAFNGLVQPNAADPAPVDRGAVGRGAGLERQGRYLLWSDIPNNRQMRWLEDDGHVSVFREPSDNSNGNTFDFQGRQISCEHLTRRVVRYELDGSITVIAEPFEGKRLNSPNDAVPHPDGSIWFTDPPYGGQLYEGAPDAAGGPSNAAAGSTRRAASRPASASSSGSCRPSSTAGTRAAAGRWSSATTGARSERPLLLARLQDALRRQHRQGTGRHRAGRQGRDLRLRRRRRQQVSNHRLFTRLRDRRREVRPRRPALRRRRQPLDLEQRRPRRRLQRRHRLEPEGKLLGRIRIPELRQLCFGGPKRNRLFMAASQSLYALYTATQGAAPA